MKVLHTTICGAQINEIDGRQGPRQVPAASARPRGLGDGARDRPRRDATSSRATPWCCTGARARASRARRRAYQLARREAQRRLGDDLQRLRHRLREPHDGDPRRLRSQGRAAARLRGDDRGRRDQQRREGEDRRVGGGVRRRRRRAATSCNSPRSPAPIRSSRSISLDGQARDGARARRHPCASMASKDTDVAAADPRHRRRQGAGQGDRDHRRASR